MRNDWLDADDVETHVYLGPDEGLGSAPIALPPPPARYPHPSGPAMVVARPIPSLAHRPSVAPRRRAPKPIVTPLTMGLAGICVLVGITIGGVIGLSGHGTAAAAPAPTRAAISVTPIAAAATPSPIIVPPAPPPPVALRVESSPPGATVMFLADGATTLVGTTPVDTTVDSSREYDVLVTLAGHTSRVEHVGPTTSHHIAVTLDPTH